MTKPDVCLQINLAPGDIRYVRRTLPHQLKVLGDQVQEIVFTLDTRQNRAFRSAARGYADKLAELRRFLGRVQLEYPHARIVEVDYSSKTRTELASAFLGNERVPLNACDGSAFYAYLFGLFSTRSDYVFHIDSDMLFGGGSQAWVSEAVDLLAAHNDILACYPFPGPPKSDRSASPRRLTSSWNDITFQQRCVASDLQVAAYSYNELTTRAFILNRRKFLAGELTIPLVTPRWRRRLKALIVNTPPFLLLEDCITVLINRAELQCIGFLGSESGMWSLHPRWRSEALYAQLGELVERVETDDIPEGQRGDFDLNDSMIDWSEVYQRAKPWRRLTRNVRLAAIGFVDRLQRSP